MDLLTKRCGCGKILRQRETCTVCTQRRREELHARGVASLEIGKSQCYRCDRWLPTGAKCEPCERALDAAVERLSAKSARREAAEAFCTYLASFANQPESRFVRVFRREMEGKRSGRWQPEHAQTMAKRVVCIGTPPNSSSYWDLPHWKPFTQETLAKLSRACSCPVGKACKFCTPNAYQELRYIGIDFGYGDKIAYWFAEPEDEGER